MEKITVEEAKFAKQEAHRLDLFIRKNAGKDDPFNVLAKARQKRDYYQAIVDRFIEQD